MIEHIQGHARFKLSGATISVNFQPQEGITAVVGPNGVGKTFSALESLRYLMFGSRALRGTLDTYAELTMTGIVAIHGQSYGIERSLKAAKIFTPDGQQLAVGQDEVTRKVEELLGYGLEVFDLCNASVQGQTQNLGALTPGKRKEKIDEVLRVTNVRAVEKALRDEANALRRESEALARSLPVRRDKPLAPADGRSSEDFKRDIDEARELYRRTLALTSQIVTITPPDEPTVPRPNPKDIAEAEELSRKRYELDTAIKAAPPAMPMTEQQVVEAEAKHEWLLARDARGNEPTLALDVVESELATWAELIRLERQPDLEVQCPRCEHEFHTRPPMPAQPDHSQGELKEERRRHEAWSEPLPTEPAGDFSLSPSAAERERAARRRWDTAREAEKALKVLPSPDFDLSEARQSLADWRAYDSAIEKKTRHDVDNAMINRQLADMPVVPDIDDLSQRMYAAKNYEDEITRWNEDEQNRQRLEDEIADLQAKAQDFLEGNKELSEARAELKSFLAPALSREASSLLSDMTNTKLQALIIDEDMNITVDGQSLETLSGAGKTVANIALRIALTKVLTGSAFPVFIGDEMDGDLDAERREATTQALVSLKQHLKQIILITHKDVDIADHVVDLGELE
jgi:DNA repair exonuclease SbcCD ATPase subunit